MNPIQKQILGLAFSISFTACAGGPGMDDASEADDEVTEALVRSSLASDVVTQPAAAVLVRKDLKDIKLVNVTLTPDQGSDLTLDDNVMHFDAGAAQGLDIHVINKGEINTKVSIAAVTVNGFRFTGHVYPYYPATSPADSLTPWTHGYIHVSVPAATLKLNLCTPYRVQIDVDHSMQLASTNRPDVVSNDSGFSWTECLTWLTPVSSAVMGQAITTAVSGQTLHNVVSGYVSGRNDGKLCSACHYAGAAGTVYHPAVAQNGSTNILPDTVVDGFTWAGDTNSWSYKFLNASYPHTDDLRAAVNRWRQDVVRQVNGQRWITVAAISNVSQLQLQLQQ